MFMAVDRERGKHRRDTLAARLERLGAHYRHRQAILEAHGTKPWRRLAESRVPQLLPRRPPLPAEVWDYALDFCRRWLLTLDTLRRRGNEFLEYEASGQPPLLAFDYEILIDGRHLGRPVNYCLVRILPPEGVEIDARKRPYLIIDPRAGHGAGIGGFKQESQVGVALREGNPVYFAVFYPDPEPGQTLAAVAAAEALFVREVARRHPDSPKPALVGNCQGGWAVMGLAAADPEISGPLILNGAPLSYWAGVHGKNPMRYFGGLAGGSWPAYLLSDLGHGKFDGAWLVQNFEALHPANTLWTKYYRLFANIDTEVKRFLDFEKWWGGFVFLNRAEMREIVDDLFVGNKLATGGIPLGRGMMLDLRKVRSPIIVFCSHGDDITPPQQALNWIVDTYFSTREIKAYGQRIVYIIHAESGHLGIFVSGAVVRREFTEIAGTLSAIEALPPGLYELEIEDVPMGKKGLPQYEVCLHEREIEDILCHDDTREDEHQFRIVAGVSEANARLYDLFVGPWVRQLSTELSAQLLRRLHPMRAQRYFWSDLNPWLWWLPEAAALAQETIRPSAVDNPMRGFQELWSELMETTLEGWGDTRDAGIEIAFHAVYGWLELLGWGQVFAEEARAAALPEKHPSEAVLARMSEGGVGEAVIRMLLLLMKVAGAVRRETLAFVQERIREAHVFAETDGRALKAMVDEQNAIVAYQPEQALETLRALLPTPQARQAALRTLRCVVPPDVLRRPALSAAIGRFEEVLGMSSDEAVKSA